MGLQDRIELSRRQFIQASLVLAGSGFLEGCTSRAGQPREPILPTSSPIAVNNNRPTNLREAASIIQRPSDLVSLSPGNIQKVPSTNIALLIDNPDPKIEIGYSPKAWQELAGFFALDRFTGFSVTLDGQNPEPVYSAYPGAQRCDAGIVFPYRRVLDEISTQFRDFDSGDQRLRLWNVYNSMVLWNFVSDLVLGSRSTPEECSFVTNPSATGPRGLLVEESFRHAPLIWTNFK